MGEGPDKYGRVEAWRLSGAQIGAVAKEAAYARDPCRVFSVVQPSANPLV